jgi:hypothetical protein
MHGSTAATDLDAFQARLGLSEGGSPGRRDAGTVPGLGAASGTSFWESSDALPDSQHQHARAGRDHAPAGAMPPICIEVLQDQPPGSGAGARTQI